MSCIVKPLKPHWFFNLSDRAHEDPRCGHRRSGQKTGQPMPRWVTRDTTQVSAIRMERRPPSARNGVRHHGGTLSGMAWNTQAQTRTRKRPQPAPMLGYGPISRPKFGLKAAKKTKHTKPTRQHRPPTLSVLHNGSTRFAPLASDRSRLIPELEKTGRCTQREIRAKWNSPPPVAADLRLPPRLLGRRRGTPLCAAASQPSPPALRAGGQRSLASLAQSRRCSFFSVR